MRSDPRRVTAIVAATDLRYLPRTLNALAAQHRQPDHVIIVDASIDGLDIARPDMGEVIDVAVRRAPAARNLGDAVRCALARPEPEGGANPWTGDEDEGHWVWLLHDDGPPEPAALAELLRATAHSGTVAIAGCKHVRAQEPDRLISVGVGMTAGGRRLTGIDEGEIDQGQYDGLDDVYAVETAGMLITRTMWERLDGPDPVLGPFGDGADLSRRARLVGARVVVAPKAIVRHHRASLLDLRSERPDPRHSFRRRRAATLHARLTGASLPGMIAWFIAMILLAPVRSLGRVATKELGIAVDELAAPLTVMGHPHAIYRARRRRSASRRVPRRSLSGLYAPRTEGLRLYRDRFLALRSARRRSDTPSELEMRERAALALRRRLTFLALVLATGAVTVMIGTGAVSSGVVGGGLTGTSGGPMDLVRAAFSPWLATGDGHPGPPDPFWAVIVLLSIITGGPLGVPTATGMGIFIALSAPLAAIAAWFAAGAATRSLTVRAWATIVWALGPPMIIAMTGGDLAALVCHIGLPLLAWSLARAFGYDRRDVIVSGLVGAARLPALGDDPQDGAGDGSAVPDEPDVADESDEERSVGAGDGADETDEGTGADAAADAGDEPPVNTSRVSRRGSLGAAAGAGLLLAITAASAPFVLPIAVIALLVLGVMTRRAWGRLIVTVLPSLVLFAPILVSLPRLWPFFVSSPGPDAPVMGAQIERAGWTVLLGWPGALPEATWILVAGSAAGASIVLAALVALIRRDAPAGRFGWLIAAGGLAAAMIIPAAGFDASRGPAVSVATAGLLLAGMVGLHGLTTRLRGHAFGWRHALAGLVVVVICAGGSGALASGWYTAAHPGNYAWRAADADPTPALARQLAGGPERSRVLALQARDGGVGAAIWRGDGPQFTDYPTVLRIREQTDQAGPDEARERLSGIVAELSVGAATDATQRLAEHAVSIVLLPPATSHGGDDDRDDLIAALDSTAGLERITENDSGVFWRVGDSSPVARVSLADSDGRRTPVPAGAVTAGGRVSADAGRTLVLAERADPGWRAWLDGRALRSVAHGWQQAFEIPSDAAGELALRYEPSGTRAWHVTLIAVFGLTFLLALPIRRRRREELT